PTMSREELLNELLVLEEEDTASRLRYAARKREVIEKLCACGKRDVLGVGLDVALVPAAVSKSGISDDGSNDYNLDVGRVLVDGAKQLVFKNDSDDCQKDEQLEILIRTESEKTLSGDDGVMDHVSLLILTKQLPLVNPSCSPLPLGYRDDENCHRGSGQNKCPR
ncbi:hypothetical protein HDU78_008897, partial [Chytriomyces hyalinus]